ncbi:hypothetical protein G5714_021280 [Onychostoma macrolepis]|uniref:Uncharacterized protein n=1 Tax=Onychostoma macrolepis TaxID=369639 RepID=A0A7J6BUE9_9TELE|nr:hypothetical protein G5714_021280 [Onychostoma macrolepis]
MSDVASPSRADVIDQKNSSSCSSHAHQSSDDQSDHGFNRITAMGDKKDQRSDVIDQKNSSSCSSHAHQSSDDQSDHSFNRITTMDVNFWEQIKLNK